MSRQSDDKKKRSGISGLAIPGGLLIGLGVDFIAGTMPAGLFIGLGSGFLIMMVVRIITGEW